MRGKEGLGLLRWGGGSFPGRPVAGEGGNLPPPCVHRGPAGEGQGSWEGGQACTRSPGPRFSTLFFHNRTLKINQQNERKNENQ